MESTKEKETEDFVGLLADIVRLGGEAELLFIGWVVAVSAAHGGITLPRPPKNAPPVTPAAEAAWERQHVAASEEEYREAIQELRAVYREAQSSQEA